MDKEELIQAGIDPDRAEKALDILHEKKGQAPYHCWEGLKKVLSPDTPKDALVRIFMEVFSQDDRFSDAPKAWEPDESEKANSNITKLCQLTGKEGVEELFEWSLTDRTAFWQTMTETLGIPFQKGPEKVIDLSEGPEKPTWFPGASFNIADACFQAEPDKTAIVYKKENGSLQTWSYRELRKMTDRVANGLRKIGFEKGQRAVIDMPMTAEAVAIYLGVVKLGGAVVSIADSLAPGEVKKRSDIAESEFFFTQYRVIRGGKEIPLFERSIEEDIPRAIVIPGHEGDDMPNLRSDDISWSDFLGSDEALRSEPCHSEDICNILFSSGTTSDPKAIPWTHTTPIKAASDGYLHHDIKSEEVVAWPTNIGWMMGPWLIFASLINKASIALYYGAPAGKDFGLFVQDAKVNMLGVIPSMVKNWIRSGELEGCDWRSIKLFSSTGEASNPQDYLWLMAKAGFRPVIEYCGGTEIGGGYVSGTLMEPASPSSFTRPCFGLDMVLVNEEGAIGEEGEVYLLPPSIGFSNTLLNKDHHKTYYEGTPEVPEGTPGISGVNLGHQMVGSTESPILRRHGDRMKVLKNGMLRPQGRADDTMNLGGIKTSSVEIEQTLDVLPGVKETAAIAVEPEEGGPSRLVIYAVTDDPSKSSEGLQEAFQKAIKEELNPLFKVQDVVIREQLPRTASNKIMRRVLRSEYQEKAV
ncbi:MAG: AMP-binding protein [Flavobacteriales bacterium]